MDRKSFFKGGTFAGAAPLAVAWQTARCGRGAAANDSLSSRGSRMTVMRG